MLNSSSQVLTIRVHSKFETSVINFSHLFNIQGKKKLDIFDLDLNVPCISKRLEYFDIGVDNVLYLRAGWLSLKQDRRPAPPIVSFNN